MLYFQKSNGDVRTCNGDIGKCIGYARDCNGYIEKCNGYIRNLNGYIRNLNGYIFYGVGVTGYRCQFPVTGNYDMKISSQSVLSHFPKT